MGGFFRVQKLDLDLDFAHFFCLDIFVSLILLIYLYILCCVGGCALLVPEGGRGCALLGPERISNFKFFF